MNTENISFQDLVSQDGSCSHKIWQNQGKPFVFLFAGLSPASSRHVKSVLIALSGTALYRKTWQ
jgi:hypothetical protein